MSQPVIKDDPFGPIRQDEQNGVLTPREVARIHSRSDVDSSVGSQHHTLGVKHTQAAPGDHTHDGAGSRKIGTGLGLTLTGAKGGNVALTNLIAMLGEVIEFTDSTT